MYILHKIVPDKIILTDLSGMPLLILPRSEEYEAISGLIAAAIAISKKLSSEEIDYIKTENGILFIKSISQKGGLCMLFENAKDPNDVYWVVYVFLNDVKDIMSFIMQGFIMESEIQAMHSIYNNFVERLQKIGDLFENIQRKYIVMKELAGTIAETTIRQCSDGVLIDIDNNLIVNTEQIKKRHISSFLLLELMMRCDDQITKKIKKII